MPHANISAMLAEDRRRNLTISAERARLARVPDSGRRRRRASSALAEWVMRLVQRPHVTRVQVVEADCAVLQEALR